MAYKVIFKQYSPDISNSGIIERARNIWLKANFRGVILNRTIEDWIQRQDGIWSRTHSITFTSKAEYDNVYAEIHAEGPIRAPGNYIEIIEKVELEN